MDREILDVIERKEKVEIVLLFFECKNLGGRCWMKKCRIYIYIFLYWI